VRSGGSDATLEDKIDYAEPRVVQGSPHKIGVMCDPPERCKQCQLLSMIGRLSSQTPRRPMSYQNII
jgi:hypothetical protein